MEGWINDLRTQNFTHSDVVYYWINNISMCLMNVGYYFWSQLLSLLQTDVYQHDVQSCSSFLCYNITWC